MVTITISSLGAPDVSLALGDGTSGPALAAAVATATRFPANRLRLVRAATSAPLDLTCAAPLALADGETLFAVVVPRAPQAPAHLRGNAAATAGPSSAHNNGDEDEDEDAHLFRVRLAGRSPAVAAAARALLRLGAPEALVAVALHPRSLRAGAWLLAWCAGAKAASLAGLGPLFLVLSIPAAIFCNLGRRRPGEASGYALFNAGFRELPGTLNGRGVDDSLRRGQM